MDVVALWPPSSSFSSFAQPPSTAPSRAPASSWEMGGRRGEERKKEELVHTFFHLLWYGGATCTRYVVIVAVAFVGSDDGPTKSSSLTAADR